MSILSTLNEKRNYSEIYEAKCLNEGQTSYYTFTKKVDSKSYKSALKDIATMLKAYTGKIIGDAYGDNKKPELTNGIEFNGIGDDSHETCSFPKLAKKGYSDFCKTNGKPYDKFVSASLLILKAYLGDSIDVSGDNGLDNGKVLANKYSKMEGNPVSVIGRKTKKDLAIETLAKLGDPNFNDRTVRINISRESYLGSNGFSLRVGFFITKERADAMKLAGVSHTSMVRPLEDYLYNRFGTMLQGQTEFYKDGKASKGLVPYKYVVKSFGNADIAYGMGANMSYTGNNEVSKNPSEVKSKIKAYNKMLDTLDSFKNDANAEIDSITSDKEEKDKIWKARFMKKYIALSDKFEKVGFKHPAIMRH